jgi:hypothetical protein
MPTSRNRRIISASTGSAVTGTGVTKAATSAWSTTLTFGAVFLGWPCTAACNAANPATNLVGPTPSRGRNSLGAHPRSAACNAAGER